MYEIIIRNGVHANIIHGTRTARNNRPQKLRARNIEMHRVHNEGANYTAGAR